MDFFGILDALARHDVSFVLIGGLAARLHGSPTVTVDVDICPARDEDNLQHLADCLKSIDARLRGVEDDVPFLLDARSLKAGRNFTFNTSLGALDILGEPAGTRGYEDLAANAIEMDIDGLTLKVASLDDLMRMKEAAGRPKDRIELEILGALRDEIEGR
ncbi:MAG TPA: hypothetical protein VEV82_03175 [Actinomycetota bacterium]|nr:hypothetical protein [Actinomycetota bacterium]